MLHFAPWKVAAIVLVCLASIVFSLPNFFAKETVQSWPAFVPRKQLALGLDLRGGAHLLLEIDTQRLRKDWLDNIRDDVRRRLREAKIGYSGLGVAGGAVTVRPGKPEELDTTLTELRRMIQQIGNPILGTSGADIDVRKGDGGSITITPTEPGWLQRLSSAISASIETLRRRIDQLGTAEATVVHQGRDRILIQYPGLQDTKVLKDLIGDTAQLSFHDVHPDLTGTARPPAGYRIYESAERDGVSYVLRETPVVKGDQLVDAQPGFDQRTNEPIISFRFNQSGARAFGKFTAENVGRPFAIVLDEKVLSAPVIREQILGGSGQISGQFTVETANKLAIQLRSGALPAKLTIVEERTVGPSLGADSIEAGKLAGIIGGIATIIMTVVAYGTFGIFAVAGLIVHALLTVSVMTVIGSTLTLPGIAGLVLTIAMAVDANVLIYERIREELRGGKTPIAAIDAGFTRAFITIADSQLTTLAAAVIMFWLGSGPIRGFAVTLSIGICTSIFASVTVVRLIVSLWLRSARQTRRAVAVPI